jgi:Protein of unknown function (DUF1279)
MIHGARQLARKYGPTGIGTYLVLSGSLWVCFFVAFENHLDVDGLLQRVFGEGVNRKEVLRNWGLTAADPEHPSIWDKAPSAVLAMVATKACVPIKIPVAAALTPYVHRLLSARGLVR